MRKCCSPPRLHLVLRRHRAQWWGLHQNLVQQSPHHSPCPSINLIIGPSVSQHPMVARLYGVGFHGILLQILCLHNCIVSPQLRSPSRFPIYQSTRNNSKIKQISPVQYWHSRQSRLNLVGVQNEVEIERRQYCSQLPHPGKPSRHGLVITLIYFPSSLIKDILFQSINTTCSFCLQGIQMVLCGYTGSGVIFNTGQCKVGWGKPEREASSSGNSSITRELGCSIKPWPHTKARPSIFLLFLVLSSLTHPAVRFVSVFCQQTWQTATCQVQWLSLTARTESSEDCKTGLTSRP